MKVRMSFLIVTMLFLIGFTSSCSKRVLEAMETHKLHDEYFILRKNGRYSIKMLMMGVIRMPDSERGKYIQSGDTVYFVKKLNKKSFETYGYGLIDTNTASFFYRLNNTTEERVFYIRKMPLKRYEK
jgi:hypothetical protein